MNLTTYNGWTNYATWRVNLEIIDGMTPKEFAGDANCDVYDLGAAISTYCADLIEADSSYGLAQDFALTFLMDVDFSQIASNLLESYPAQAEGSQS
jgi:hypothetical protein